MLIRRALLIAIFSLLTLNLPTASAAKIGAQCGGLVGLLCDGGQYCQMKPGTCGIVDMFGTCVKVPQFCTEQYRPVCGCDGKTYGNECSMRQARMSKKYDGKCRTM